MWGALPLRRFTATATSTGKAGVARGVRHACHLPEPASERKRYGPVVRVISVPLGAEPCGL
jgi:hypothetical protein